ncbi:MAG: hypothetical protein HZA82_04660 [Thaumarchaeota archaeon]|nr:hypothetical protein [Nitrososphaerota archaeon]
MQKAVIIVILVMLAFSILPQYSFGHGASSETLAPQKLGDKIVTMEVSSNTDSVTKAKQVTFSLIDTNTKVTLRDVTYHIKTVKNNEILFEGNFSTDNGKLRFELIPTDAKQIKTEEKRGGGLFGMLLGMKDNFVEARGNTFYKGGLYKFEISIVSAENTNLEKPIRFDAGISFLESSTITANTDSGKQQIKILSYYDIPENTGYNKETKSISYSMPFDWSDSSINQTSVVHQEVFIPKSFAELLATKYWLLVNGIPISDTAVIIDDYSDSSARIIHVVMNNSVLQNLKQAKENNHQDMRFSLQPSKEDSFPITRYTSNAQYKVNLSWDPPTIISGSDVKLFFTIQEAYLITNRTVPASYDLKVMQNDHTLFRTSGTTSSQQGAKNMVTVPILGDTTGPITIKFENIGGNNLASAEFITSVEKPPIQSPTFPIKLTSVLPNSKEGNYGIDLTWFPSTISTNEQTEFVLTIKDRMDKPIPKSSFDFVILQKGNEVFRQAASASAGGTYIDYTFAKEQEGPTTLRIENINHSNETAELTVVVTPEFPLEIMLTLGFGMAMVLARFKKCKPVT